MLGDAPLLEADHEHAAIVLAHLLVLHDVDVAALVPCHGTARQRVRDAADVDILHRAEKADEVEDDRPHAEVAQLKELGILRALRLVE